MKLRMIATPIAMLAIGTAMLAAQAMTSPAYAAGNVVAPAIPWSTNLPAALNTAKAEGKNVYVDFSATWCEWCQKMDQDTYSNASVQAALANFVPVRIDSDANPNLVTQYQISGYPTALVMSPSGTVIKSIVGYEAPGDLLAQIGK